MRETVMEHYHHYYVHPGVWKMATMIRRTYNWPGLLDEIANYVRNCVECHVIKSRREQLHGPLKPIESTHPGEIVCIDFFGPLPKARGSCTMVLAVMDHFTKYLRLFPMKSATTSNAIKFVEKFEHEVCKIESILSDNGPQFASHQWRDYWKKKNVQLRFTSFYTPQSNPAERVMSTIAEVFRHKTRYQHTKWVEYLRDVEHKHNNVAHKSHGGVPYELMFGKPAPSVTPKSIATPEIMDHKDAAENLKKSAIKRKQYFDKQNKLTTLRPGDEVYVISHQQSDAAANYTAKLDVKYEGPFQVVKELHTNVYLIEDPDTDELFRKNIRELRRVS